MNTVSIEHDCDNRSPRNDMDNLGKMICFHGRYNLGDNHKMNIGEAVEFENRTDIIATHV